MEERHKWGAFFRFGMYELINGWLENRSSIISLSFYLHCLPEYVPQHRASLHISYALRARMPARNHSCITLYIDF